MSQPKIEPLKWRCPKCAAAPYISCTIDGGVHRQRVHYAAYMAYNQNANHTDAINFSLYRRK